MDKEIIRDYIRFLNNVYESGNGMLFEVAYVLKDFEDYCDCDIEKDEVIQKMYKYLNNVNDTLIKEDIESDIINLLNEKN